MKLYPLVTNGSFPRRKAVFPFSHVPSWYSA